MRNPILLILSILIFAACSKKQELNDAQLIIDKAIEAHGGDRYKDASIEFDFRGRHYSSERNGGRYIYTRVTSDSIGEIKDVLINSVKFKRYLNNKEVVISEERKEAFTSSVNSVLYFVQLPYQLNDKAVNKEFLGSSQVEGKEYYKVGVTFSQVGGGEDFEDRFCYWINKESFTVDYLSYSYVEKDGMGTRFRKAFNRKTVDGITFQDYINYKPIGDENKAVETLDLLFEKGQLEELSRIENTNIVVRKQIAAS